MREDRRRTVRRGCLVAAGVCLLLAAAVPAAPAQEDDTVPRPEVFSGAASSQVASVQVDRDALLPVPELFRFIALDGASAYESSTRAARASLFFPGNGLILGPSLACGTFGGQFPPDFKPILDTCLQYKYPLTVFADDFEPDGSTTGSLALGAPTDPVSGEAVGAVAHAGEDAATTTAAMQDLRVTGLPAIGSISPLLPGVEPDASLLTIESATSRTDQRIVRGSLVVDARATLSGVRLLGGLIDIGSVRSHSRVTDDANGTRVVDASLEVTGVTVGGVPAQLTEDGLVLGDPEGATGPLDQQLQSQLNTLLTQLGVQVSILDAEELSDDETGGVASVGGLLIEAAVPVNDLSVLPGPQGDIDPNGTYEASIQLGSTAARGVAFSFGTEAVPDPSTDGGFGSTDSGGAFDEAFDGVGGGGLPLPNESPDQTSSPDRPAAERPAVPDQLIRSAGDPFGGRLGFVYLSFMFAVLGLCIAPRFAVPARFPGPTS